MRAKIVNQFQFGFEKLKKKRFIAIYGTQECTSNWWKETDKNKNEQKS